MFQLQKRIALYFYFVSVRSSKRERLIKILTSKTSKNKLDIAAIPAAFDEVRRLREKWQSSTSFVGFDDHGLCTIIKAQKDHDGIETLRIDLDLPGYGHFSPNEVVSYQNKYDDNRDHIFGGRRFKLFCLNPMKRWKVHFRGPLIHMNANGTQLHASVSLYWHCFFDPYDHLLTPSCWQLACKLSHLKWKDIFQFSAFDNTVGYEQWGELRGRINIETCDEIAVRLKCVREVTFRHKNFNDFQPVSRQSFVVKESGLSFSSQDMKLANNFVQSGYMSFPIGDIISTRLQSVKASDDGRSSFKSYSILAGDMCYHVSDILTRPCFTNGNSDFKFTTLTVNGKNAFGVQSFFDISPAATEVEMGERTQEESIYINNAEVSFTGDQPAVINLGTPACMLKSLVGGKAYHLSVLKSSARFNVPDGFCITTWAFTQHINSNNVLQKVMWEIKEVLNNLQGKTLQQTCDGAVRSLQQTVLNDDLQRLVRKHLNEVFGAGKWKNMTFAIRSSSISEDALETSTAGQLVTYLGVQGFDHIISAIQHCWASSVSNRVVEYRRQNGQEPFESVGVVVQEMVDADVAGVLFTADPVTCNESNLIITANYGLGESVVSGTANPDTVVVTRGDCCKLQIKKIHNHNKETRIVSGNTNITTRDSSSSLDKASICISDTDIIRISEQGIEIENLFDSPQDIEWAIAKGELFIIQSRPISMFDIESNDELIHEFDTPVVSKKQFISPGNIQEMMPGAMSTLTGDLFIYAGNRANVYHLHSRLGIRPPLHAFIQVLSFSGHPFHNVTGWALKDISGLGGDSAKSKAEVSIVGQPVKEHTINDIKDFYGRNISYRSKAWNSFREIVVLNRHDSKLYKRLVDTIKTTPFEMHAETARELYERIDKNIIIYFDMWKAYTYKVTVSMHAFGIIMKILKGNAMDINEEHMADMALILSECKNVISAEVPCFVHDLAKQIAKSDIKEQFLNRSPEDCDSLLRNSIDDKLKSDYIHFMEIHGHRSVREPEFIDKSWSQNPSQLMQTIQLVVKEGSFPEKQKNCRTVNEIVDGLQTDLSMFQKMLLKLYFVENGMKQAGTRELAKSHLVKVIDIFRQAYWKLAELMVKESRLPQPELLFFLTHREIGELIKLRSIQLVRLSKRRQRLLPEMDKITYSKINIGQPQPIQGVESTRQSLSNVYLQGMPVCRGKAEGRACVIESINDAYQLLEGDVLVCKFTDIGWSPFYPLLSGLATEMGGLLSHGAIIAREYGIPCVVNITGVTDVIQTGDRVIVDGTAGTISKL